MTKDLNTVGKALEILNDSDYDVEIILNGKKIAYANHLHKIYFDGNWDYDVWIKLNIKEEFKIVVDKTTLKLIVGENEECA